jgi:hypothetical protein
MRKVKGAMRGDAFLNCSSHIVEILSGVEDADAKNYDRLKITA